MADLEIDVGIIGGGAVGCAIAAQLTENYSVILFEKNHNFGDEQSGRNSGVSHAGLYYSPKSLAAQLCIEGQRMLKAFCEKHNISYKETGKIIVPQNPHDRNGRKGIEDILANAIASGAEDLSIMEGSDIQKVEPNVVAALALYSPRTGIVDASSYVQRLAGIAERKGVYMLNGTKIRGVAARADGFDIETEKKGSCHVKILINSAGLGAIDVEKMLNPENEETCVYVRGEYCSYIPRTERGKIRGNIYPLPDAMGLGVHLTPTFDSGKILVGPFYRAVSSPTDYGSNLLEPHTFVEAVAPFFPGIKEEELHQDYAGITMRLNGIKDFVIKRDPKYASCIHLLGIKSPGLTASLAIAEYVKRML
ncbi:FAD-dependent oxidoreductase [Candidatus Woesearchaeota archaeon]|nr:FAD-dependent oxidoreductase [Candidatus Woesearchaeota archaeon]